MTNADARTGSSTRGCTYRSRRASVLRDVYAIRGGCERAMASTSRLLALSAGEATRTLEQKTEPGR